MRVDTGEVIDCTPSKPTTVVDGRRDLFPRTRYQGSKRKLAAAILRHLGTLEFKTALDAFGGTGAVAYALKRAGKHVTYNDILAFNHQIGRALVENDTVRLAPTEIASIGRRSAGVTYGDFIERTFEGIYFTTAENRWLDVAVQNIGHMDCRYKRAMAWFALFQSAMAKRPYNLFHRRNLYMRMADVQRGFGNKASWDRSFDDHFAVFSREAANALVDANGACRAICRDALDVEPSYDLVYIDTPYINRAGVGVDYRDFYHFLEGMVRYNEWPDLIDRKSKHRRLVRCDAPWSDPVASEQMFARLFKHFRGSILAVSYRGDGIPAIEKLIGLMQAFKRSVGVVEDVRYQYALSRKRSTREFLLIGVD